MKPIQSMAALLVLAVWDLGCGDTIVSPRSAEVLPQPTFAAFQERGEGVFVSSGEYGLDCLTEIVHEVRTEIPFRYHLTVTPNGNTILTDPFIPGTGTGTLVGLTSGTIWTLDRVMSPDVQLVTAAQMYTFTANIWWVSETGPTINIHSLFHISTNADGEITSAKIDLADCQLHSE